MPFVVYTFSILYNFNSSLNIWSCVMGSEYRSAGCEPASCWETCSHRALARHWLRCRAFFLPLQPRSLKTHSAFIPISCVFPAVNFFLPYQQQIMFTIQRDPQVCAASVRCLPLHTIRRSRGPQHPRPHSKHCRQPLCFSESMSLRCLPGLCVSDAFGVPLPRQL